MVLPSHRPINMQSEPEWKYVVTSTDDNNTWKAYYDAANIDRQQAGIVRVWLKQVPITKTKTEKLRIVNRIIENRILNKMSVKGYERYAYSLTLLEIDCPRSQGRSISIKDYDQTDKLLSSDTVQGTPFAPILEMSWPAMIRDAVCK